MQMNEEYYSRFPTVLRKALVDGKVQFPCSLQTEYRDMKVYRGVTYSKEKRVIDKSDFASNIERNIKNPMVPVDRDNISAYSCSCYMKIDQMRVCAKFPRKNKAIAEGILKKEFGPIDMNENTSHVDLYLFDGIDPSDEFKVVEIWKENG